MHPATTSHLTEQHAADLRRAADAHRLAAQARGRRRVPPARLRWPWPDRRPVVVAYAPCV